MRYEYFLYNLIFQLYPRANITLSFATKKIKKKKLYFVKCYPNVKLTNLKPREGRDGFFLVRYRKEGDLGLFSTLVPNVF